MSNLLGLTDVPATADLFDIEPYIDGLTSFIRECKTPMTISIQGTWGTGKTSIMKMIEERLNEQSDLYKCVTFNTWEFSQFNLEDNISLVMIQSLIQALSGQDKSRGETIVNIINILASIGAGFLSGGADINFKEALQKGYLEQIHGLKKEFQLLVNKKIGLVEEKYTLGKSYEKDNTVLNCQEGNKRIVFFIDDLDRLNPEKAVELLEVLKNFLDCKNCVFILAIDYDVVWRGVAYKYGNLIGDDPEEIKKKGKDFFDKIIQVPFKMPVASFKVRNYIEECLKEINIPISKNDIDTYMSLVKNSIGTNPRNLKRIINSLALLVKVIGEKQLNEINGYKLLFGALCMQHAYEKTYNYLVENSLKIEYDQLVCLSEGSLDDVKHQFDDFEISEYDFSELQSFMTVFIRKAMDLNNSGIIEIDGENNEMDYLREILGMSAITSGTTEVVEKKKTAIPVSRNDMRHKHFSEEQVDYIIKFIKNSFPDNIEIEEKYVNTKKYGHAEYRISGKKVFDLVFYDEPKEWAEICCIPRDVSLWDKPELTEICERRSIMKGISYLAYKGISFKYRFDGDELQDKDLSILVNACVKDAIGK